MLIVKPGSRQFYEAFHNAYQIVPPVFAGVCGIAYARRGQHRSTTRRIGWLLIGLGSLSFALGQSIWTYYESICGIDAPFPSWADAGYLGTIPLLISGVILLFGSIHSAGRARLVLDCAIAASGVGVLSWYFLVQRLWRQSDVLLLGKIIGVAYPLGDVAVLFGAIVLFNGPTTDKNLRRSLAFLASGLMLLAFADTTFSFYTLNEIYQTGSWFDWGFSFGWLLIGYASLMPLWWLRQNAQPNQERKAPKRAAATPSLVRMVAPYLTAAFAFSVIAAADYMHLGRVSRAVYGAALGLFFLVILRQVFTLLENQHLTAQLRAFNENLEQMVARRTKQLTALHQLTKAVNDTLEVEQVLSAAVEHTQQALSADAVALWRRENDVSQEAPGSRAPACAFLHRGLEDQPDTLNLLGELPVRGQLETVPLPPASSLLRAPLLWRQRPIGMIGVIRWNGSFGATDPQMLESIGLEVGTALENARLYGAAVEAADRDPVTGLLNHRAIHQRLDTELQQARVQNRPLALIMMDMDNFKLFNDTYGHPAGDQVLKRVAQALGEECEKRDILGRYGGDEFIALLPDSDAQEAAVLAQHLRDRMVREGFQPGARGAGEGDERTIPVTLSFGVAAFPEDSTNRHELLTIADANLYAAKHSDEGIIGTTQTQRANRALRTEGSFGLLDAIVTTVDNKDRYTRRHSEDVTEYSLWIAEELGLSEETMRIIRVGGLLHDLGKIGVPDAILRKPGRLTAEEYEVMKRHPEIGALIVGAMPDMEAIVDAVRSHHERWDGKGYPDALAGEQIPLLGRLLAVADAFSAMTTARPYRKGLDGDAALKEIWANTGTQFDPAMAQAFVNAAARRRPARPLQAPSCTDRMPWAA
jgi:diguanylate cyclase (GGDEF)-like protein/putative nucleotidyltransferase with HDIG domain